MGFPGGSVVKTQCQCRRRRFDPRVGKIPWRRQWQPTPVFLPGKSHGQRRLAGHSPWGHRQSDVTQRLNNNKIKNRLGTAPQVLPPVKTVSFNHAVVCFLFIGFYISVLEFLSTSYPECHNIVCVYIYSISCLNLFPWVVSGNR